MSNGIVRTLRISLWIGRQLVKQEDICADETAQAGCCYADLCVEAAQSGQPWSLTIDDTTRKQRLFDIRGGH
jgi:hypothetical protein